MIDPVVIILSAPYSHASAVCAMLGQHPELYALPDTNLFLADDVERVLAAHASLGNGAGDGLSRLMAQLLEGEQGENAVATAAQWLHEHGDWTSRRLLDFVYEKYQPRYLVDSSPSTGVNAASLARMRTAYPDANFLHLVSHPRYAADRFTGDPAYADALRGLFETDPDIESVWYVPNNLLAEFARSLPPGQCMRMRVEDLLGDARNYLLQLAQWLDVSTSDESISAMLHPENSPFAARGPVSAPGGMDVVFLDHPGMPASTAPVSLAAGPAFGRVFSREALKLAKEFGYR